MRCIYKLRVVISKGAKLAKTPPLKKKLAAEFIGTFLFVFVGAGAVVATQFLSPSYPSLLVIAFANGLGLALAISVALNISGGHINPAVTIAAWATKMINTSEAVYYMVAQIIGAIAAGFLIAGLFPAATGASVFYGTPTLSPSINVLQGIGLEAVMTFFLVFVIFGTIVDKRAPRLGGLLAGLTVVVDVLAGGVFTGAAMNPARAIGPAIASMHLTNWYVYWTGPIIGAVLAALIYTYLSEGK